MDIREKLELRPKTTMRIGGTARAFADLVTKEDVISAVAWADEKKLPLLPLGSGSNTIFENGDIGALVVQLKHAVVGVDGNRVTVGAGKNLPMLINELGAQGLDLSALTGIPGTVGGALFGNAGQGPKGIWIDSFVRSVTVYTGGEWKSFTKSECHFRYRESAFKDHTGPLVIWEAVLQIPSDEPATIKANIESLLWRRIETQPHVKTAGSCFKAVGETPAWQLIDAAGLRGFRVGGVEISPKHANFLTNVGEATFSDAAEVVNAVKKAIPQGLEVEMRFVQADGTLLF